MIEKIILSYVKCPVNFPSLPSALFQIIRL